MRLLPNESPSDQTPRGRDVEPLPQLPELDEVARRARDIGAALGLGGPTIDRLANAVRVSGHPPCVSVSLLGLASDQSVAEAAAELYQAPLWGAEIVPAAADGQHGINPAFLQDNYALVLHADSERIVIGLVDPGLEHVRQGAALGARRPTEYATITLGQWRSARGESETAAPGVASTDTWRDDVDRLDDFARDAPAVRYLDEVLSRAIAVGASDIHFEQKADQSIVRFRIDGLLRTMAELPTSFGAGVIARLKVLAELDVASVRSAQDGRTTVSIGGVPTDLRVSTTPTVNGESAAIRLLSRQGLDFTLDSLGFDEGVTSILRKQLRQPHGLVLVTGPTGSGKTTTLYAALRELATPERKVLTVEDPVEYVFEGINQTQVNEAAGITFASALRAFLRHDPDVILVGEIRDDETARLAVQAALTGHLVLATLHTNDAISASARLADMGVERYLLAGVLVGVSAQRLAPKLCLACAEPYKPTKEEASILKEHGFATARSLRRAPGCPACDGLGRKGRAVIGEIHSITPVLERLIATGAPTADLREHVENCPSRGLAQSALERATNGVIDLRDAFAIAGI